MAMSRDFLAAELQELIAALDRRVPRVEQAGEIGIARDAAALREKALDRLRELEERRAAADPPDQRSSGAGSSERG
jgi:hypothetical protein